MKQTLLKITKVRNFAKTATLISIGVNILSIIGIGVLIGEAVKNFNPKHLSLPSGPFIFIIIVALVGGVLNTIFLILILVNSTSIYLYDLKSEKHKEIIFSYRRIVLILSIIAFFIFSFILLIVIWAMSNSKITFLMQEIAKLEIENNQTV